MAAPAPLLRLPVGLWMSVLSLSGVKVAVSACAVAQAIASAEKSHSDLNIFSPIAITRVFGATGEAARRKGESGPLPSDNVPRPPPGLLNSSLISADHQI